MITLARVGIVLLGAVWGASCSSSSRQENDTFAADGPSETEGSGETGGALDQGDLPNATGRSDLDDAPNDDAPNDDAQRPATTEAPPPVGRNEPDSGVETPSEHLDTECEEVNACPETPAEAKYEPCADKACGEACRVCAPDDSECREDPDLKVCDARGRCEAFTVNCEPLPEVSLFDCVVPDEFPDPICAPADFLSTDAECVEQSWVWNGCECTPVTHCGCASGDCDRLFPDYASCKAVQMPCFPGGCVPEDAVSNGTMCGSTYGYAFTGHGCEHVICGCRGADCLGTADTLVECEARWSVCLDRTPECSAPRFPVVKTGQFYEPEYPEFGFSVQGYDDLYDSATGEVAVFADWTAAQWVGWEAVLEQPSDHCPAVRTLPASFRCPQPRPLALQVGDETIRVNIQMLWSSTFFWTTASPPNVSVRISPHPTGTLVLEIRDQATGLPVIAVVQSELGLAAGQGPWELQPFTITPDGTFCRTDPEDCNWSFAALGLKASTADTEWSIDPLDFQYLQTPEANYTLVNGYVFQQAHAANTSCAQRYAPRQNFVLFQSPHPG